MADFTFISGATGGIGKAFCIECASRGDNLFLTGRSEEKLLALKNELLSLNENIVIKTCACDLTCEEDRKNLLRKIDNDGVRFNNVINVAGVDIQKAFLDYTEEKVLFQIRVNVESTISLTHALLSRRGENLKIITVSSMSGVSPMPYFALYSATKAMLTNFFTSLRIELKGEGVKVTTVLPGGVPTRPDIIEDIKGQGLWGKLSAKSPKFVAQGALKAVEKNKNKYIPGGFNKLLYFIMKLIPQKLQLIFIAKRWKKQTKDAF